MPFSPWHYRQLKAKIAHDPYYRLQSLEEVAIAVGLGLKIDVTAATVDDWLRLPGISIHQARTLVELVSLGVSLLSIEDVAAALNLSSQRLKPLEPLLQFCYYDPGSLLTPQRLNPNTANLEELQKIAFVDLTLAQAILKNRQEQGMYKDITDFQRRLSLPKDCISQLLHYLTF
jgi:DNA uptake protein ComE-like DNA-binding protein